MRQGWGCASENHWIAKLEHEFRSGCFRVTLVMPVTVKRSRIVASIRPSQRFKQNGFHISVLSQATGDCCDMPELRARL